MASPNPTDWLVPFTWHGVDDDNNPATGKLVCTARALQISSPDDVDPIRVYTGPITVDIVRGIAQGELLASDWPNNSNQNYTWHIEEQITNGTGMSYDVVVPISMQAKGILLSAYAPTQPTSGLPAMLVTRAEFDALARRVDDLQGISAGDGEITRMTFDEGVEGALLIAGGDVYAVTNKVRYTSAAAKYSFGKGVALNGPVGDYGAFSVNSPNATASDWQIYLRLRTVGTSTCETISFTNEVFGGDSLPTLLIRTSKMLVLQAPAIGGFSSDDDVALGVQFPVNTWIRLDIRIQNDGTNNIYKVQGFWTDAEGTIADAALGATFPGPTVDRLRFQVQSGDKTWWMDLDTLGYKAGITNPIPPYQPSMPVWNHEYEAANDRALLVGDVGLEDAITAVGCQSLVAAAKHGPRGLRTTNGYAEYPVRNSAGQTASVYLNKRTSGTNISTVVGFMAGGVQVGAIRLRTGGGAANMFVAGPNGLVNPGGASNVNGVVPNQWFRLDYSHTWTPAAGGTLTITVRYNWPAAEAGDGVTYEMLGPCVFTGVAQPTTTRIGFSDTSGGTWMGDVDSHRSNSNTTDLTTWGPVQASAIQAYVYALCGFTGPTSAEIKANVVGYTSMNCAWSATGDANGNPTGTLAYLGPKVPDVNGLVKWDVTGLTAGVPRYFKLSPDGAGTLFGDSMTITPRPADNTAFSNWRISYMCCQATQNIGGDGGTPITPVAPGGTYYEPCWIDSLAWKANEIWFTGDGGYWGSKNAPKDTPWTMSQRWIAWLSTMPKQRAALASAPSRWEKDDHEVTSADKDSNVEPGLSATRKLHNTEAGMPAIFPYYPLKGVVQTDSYGTFRQSMFGWEMFTSRIRIVYLDAYCMQRSSWADPDQGGAGFGSHSNGTEKTWMGVEQDTLLEALLTTGTQPPLTIFVCGKTFLGRIANPLAPVPNDYDKIWNYDAWRVWFSAMVKNLPGAIWLGGDRHANAYAPAEYNPWCPMPCYISSPTAMHNLRSTPKELAFNGNKPGVTEGYTLIDPLSFIDATPGNFSRTLMTYMRYSLSDDNAGTITFTGRSRYHPNDWDGSNPASEMDLWPTWAGQPLIDGFTATDVFHY